MRATYAALKAAPLPKPIAVLENWQEPEQPLTISRDNEFYVVRGTWVERRIAMTDMQNEDAVRRLQRAFRRYGVFDALRAAGIKEGDPVRIRDVELEFTDDPDLDQHR